METVDEFAYDKTFRSPFLEAGQSLCARGVASTAAAVAMIGTSRQLASMEMNIVNGDNMNMPWQKRALIAMTLAIPLLLSAAAQAQQQPPRPNIVIIWGDDVGQSNISAYSHGMMGYTTPNIDRLAKEGVMFTDYYAERSCTAGRASFITGQSGLWTGMTKVGLPGATLGLQKEDPTIAELLKPLGYATGQ